MHDNFDEEIVKNRILSENKTFKSAFSATLGYYAARMLVNFFGVVLVGLTAFLIYKLLK